jgi:hypothetical protein
VVQKIIPWNGMEIDKTLWNGMWNERKFMEWNANGMKVVEKLWNGMKMEFKFSIFWTTYIQHKLYSI